MKGFFGTYRFLSNFYPSEIIYDGHKYPTVEHAFQAAKTHDLWESEEIRLSEKAKDAKSLGKSVTLRPDWEDIKYNVMETLVRKKFTNNAGLRAKLLVTGNAYLEETNTWNDVTWGVCNGVGKNWLGEILMKIRDELNINS